VAAIVGRAFTKVHDYQFLLDKTQDDWQSFPKDEFLKNLHFAQSEEELRECAAQMQNLKQEDLEQLIEFVARTEPNPYTKLPEDELPAVSAQVLPPSKPTGNGNGNRREGLTLIKSNPPQFVERENKEDPNKETLEDFSAWQLFTDVLLDKSFKDACNETLRFLSARFGFKNLGWLERSQYFFKPFIVADNLRDVLTKFSLSADDARLHEAALNETSWHLTAPHKLEIFPLAVGNDIRAAVMVSDEIASEARRKRVARFCSQIAVSLEVLRLREELSRRAEIVRGVQLFSEKLNASEEVITDETTVNLFDTLLQTCAELLQAERGSLLMFDEAEQRLKVEAAIGHRAAEVKETKIAVGERIAERVWRDGKPVIVENVANINHEPAPLERGYRSKSFISFPLFVGNRVIGVLNVTDKIGGGSYDAGDLEMLEAIAPQMAIALDRATLQQRAGIFEQLSITDALTGLLNRRYLNERLQEEVNRSNRDGSPMSFMMIDIDNFKQYNDHYGHPAGDEVLRVTAQCLKAVLRSADVAARFGGEEFCLLLPNTTLSEARMIGERIRMRIEGTNFPHRIVTVSVGVSAYSPLHNSPQEIIEAADKALYQAKRIGKNNVQLWLFGQTRH
jgi:diguanylate cyclase (GGDEF)-like protein